MDMDSQYICCHLVTKYARKHGINAINLLLNSDKMEALVFGPENLLQHNFNLEGCPVTLSTTVKDLGIILDRNLYFENHISCYNNSLIPP